MATDGLTYQEMIVQSEVAKRLISEASPIYEDSYVGCWIFEILGRSWDSIWAIIDDMPGQLFPQSVTWLIELWERRYDITPNVGDDIETRRRRLMEAEARPSPFTPWSLDRYVQSLCNRNAVVNEHIAPYTFGVYIVDNPDSEPLDYSAVRKWIIRHKHSHMSFELYTEADSRITIKTETMYWKFQHQLSGTEPQRNIPGDVERSKVVVNSAGDGQVFGYPMAGNEDAGTIPQVNITTGTDRTSLTAAVSGAGYTHRYIPCGAISSGGGIL